MGNARIQLRRGSRAFWESENPILRSGEPGVETHAGHPAKLKIGDGATPWAELPYSSGGADLPVDQASLAEHVNAATPHPVYDNGPDLTVIYENAKV